MKARKYITMALVAASAVVADGVMTSAHGAVPAAATESAATLPGAEGWLERARQMYADGNYRGCADQLRSMERLTPSQEVLLAKALLRAGDDECLTLARSIRQRLGNAPQGIEALLIEGDWLFLHGQYGPASLCYEQAADADLRPEYAYRLGVSYLRTGAFDKGRRLLRPLSLGGSRYHAPALFYLAWADYAQKDSRAALQGFERVAPLLGAVNARCTGDDDQFLPTHLEAGYYIAQIELEQRNYAKAASIAKRLLQQPADELYTRELNRVAGEALFKLDRLNEAEPYLQAYLTGNTAITPTAAYAAGAIAYNNGDTERARELLEPVADLPDNTGQGASLLLGQIAVSKGDFTEAAFYFDKSRRQGTDEKVAERGFYNYITALSHGADTPFASATELPELFLRTFPGSQYESRVRQLLTEAYYRDKDYVKALQHLDKIPRLTAQQQAVRQLVLYELGVSELSNADYKGAEQHLQMAAQGTDARVRAQAQLWLGQALYAQGKFANADRAYKSYLQAEPQGANAAQAHYDAAYSLYMQDKFKEAASEFAKALAAKNLPARLRTDATVRLADCRYYLRDYSAAAELYSQAEKSGEGDAAYAAMRAAMMLGLRGDLNAEIAGLQRMVATYPDSRWCAAAMYETGLAQAKVNDEVGAVKTFEELVRRYTQLEEGRRAQLQIATLYMQQNADDKAIAAYKEVIKRWPTGEEARLANVELRRLMAAQGQTAEYAAFMNSVPGAPKIDTAELERLDYEAADNKLIADPKDSAAMKQYLSRYPDGRYLAAALWRLAQAQDETGDAQGALQSIAQMESKRPDAQQLPEALVLKASILEGSDPAAALATYRRAEKMLGADMPQEVYAGIMRLTSDAQERLNYARRVKEMGSLSSEQAQEADFYEASALAATGDEAQALKMFRTLAAQPSSLYGARAAVAGGLLLIKQQRYKEAQKMLEAFTNAGSPHAYWLARGYIALADAVGMQGKKALARDYLNSLKKYYPGDEDDIRQLIADGLKKYK